MLSKEQFIAKYQYDLAGRILAGITAPASYPNLGEYARDVQVGCHAWLDKIFTELVPQTPVPKGKA